MRGLKCDRTARVIMHGNAFTQSVRRGHYEFGIDARVHRRVAAAFTELARTISPKIEQGPVPRESVHLNATEPFHRVDGLAHAPVGSGCRATGQQPSESSGKSRRLAWEAGSGAAIEPKRVKGFRVLSVTH